MDYDDFDFSYENAQENGQFGLEQSSEQQTNISKPLVTIVMQLNSYFQTPHFQTENEIFKVKQDSNP